MSATHIRVGFKLPREVVAQWDEWAKMFGISRTSLVVTATAIGGKRLEREMLPENFVTPSLLKALEGAGLLDREYYESYAKALVNREAATYEQEEEQG